jgi:hypothetical protein
MTDELDPDRLREDRDERSRLATEEPWEMLVTDVVDNEDGGTTITFDLDKEAHKAMANLGVQFVLHCAAAQVDMQVALDAILKMGNLEND